MTDKEIDVDALKESLNEVVDLMIQIESFRTLLNDKKKEIKEIYGIPVALITKSAAIIRKQNFQEEDEKWELVKSLVT